jgi:malate dehydrogenase (oxaloacetate-decarboxylating)
MGLKKETLQLHKEHRGKIEIASKVKLKDRHDLSLAYTPGVAIACKEILQNRQRVYDYTAKGTSVAIVTDGTAVLGLGDVGSEAALPVMEGKAVLFKLLAGIDAYPICLDTKDPKEIVKVVKFIAPGFSGINLEDIASPVCFEVEEKLKKELSIPVFHDDQHGTAVVVWAGLLNALKITDKKKGNLKIVINGAGAGGIAVARFLLNLKLGNVILCDRKGAIYSGRRRHMNRYKEKIARISNKRNQKGALKDVMNGADIFIGLSAGKVVTGSMISSMAPDPIVFALANPIPEIMPSGARKAGARVVATGRSDFPNQINNVLAFPGIFKGALRAAATAITPEMKLAASAAIASSIKPNELREDYIIPDPLNPEVVRKVSRAVAQVARRRS